MHTTESTILQIGLLDIKIFNTKCDTHLGQTVAVLYSYFKLLQIFVLITYLVFPMPSICIFLPGRN